MTARYLAGRIFRSAILNHLTPLSRSFVLVQRNNSSTGRRPFYKRGGLGAQYERIILIEFILILPLEMCSYFDGLSMNGYVAHSDLYTKPTSPITLSSSKGESENYDDFHVSVSDFLNAI